MQIPSLVVGKTRTKFKAYSHPWPDPDRNNAYRTNANMSQVISRHNKQVSSNAKETTLTRPEPEQLPRKTPETQISTLDSANQV